MSLVFGLYTSLVGVATVFVTLLAIVATSIVLRRLLCRRVEDAKDEDRRLEKVAAIAAAQYYMNLEGGLPKVRDVARPFRWSTIARIEALGIRSLRFR